MRSAHKIILISLISSLLLISLTGCQSILSSRMPTGSVSMAASYREAVQGEHHASFKNTMLNVVRGSTQKQCKYFIKLDNLSNPKITLYIYAHEAGIGVNQVIVPAYATSFLLYPVVL